MLKSLSKSLKNEELKLLIRSTKLLQESSASTIHNLYDVINSINQGINSRKGLVEIHHFNEYTLQLLRLLRDLKLIYNYEVKVIAVESRQNVNDISYVLRA